MIQYEGDEQDQAELINIKYGRILIISISTAGGTEEQGDINIFNRLDDIYRFLKDLNQGNMFYRSFPPQPTLFKSCIEQIEEEGGNEEVESKLINKWSNSIKDWTNLVKAEILNTYIYKRNKRPFQFEDDQNEYYNDHLEEEDYYQEDQNDEYEY
ncbi:MAG: hypothetical protein EZS28_037266 [Streblomastix strix]|uniref:Uncharacterized protein n=1 Tax=Streblomastix strix TaxID=222440 RepID=A0A5J4U9F0_9EUKA|nr:MAG: hypothetical protein EZS28_037266 [Streblomastix strix]